MVDDRLRPSFGRAVSGIPFHRAGNTSECSRRFSKGLEPVVAFDQSDCSLRPGWPQRYVLYEHLSYSQVAEQIVMSHQAALLQVRLEPGLEIARSQQSKTF
jgi:hypothetical protein